MRNHGVSGSPTDFRFLRKALRKTLGTDLLPRPLPAALSPGTGDRLPLPPSRRGISGAVPTAWRFVVDCACLHPFNNEIFTVALEGSIAFPILQLMKLRLRATTCPCLRFVHSGGGTHAYLF